MEHLTHSPHIVHHPFHHSPHLHNQSQTQSQFQSHPYSPNQPSSSTSVPHTPTSGSFSTLGPSAGHVNGHEDERNVASGSGTRLDELGQDGPMMFMDLGGSAYDALENMMAGDGPHGVEGNGIEMGLDGRVGDELGIASGGSGGGGGRPVIPMASGSGLGSGSGSGGPGHYHHRDMSSVNLQAGDLGYIPSPVLSTHRSDDLTSSNQTHPSSQSHAQSQPQAQPQSQDLDGLYNELNGLTNVVSPGQYFDFDMANFGGLDAGLASEDVLGMGRIEEKTGLGSESGMNGQQGGNAAASRFEGVEGGGDIPNGVEITDHAPVQPDAEGGYQAKSTAQEEQSLLDALQAGLLQQQLEHFQLQSPALLAGLSGHGQSSMSGSIQVGQGHSRGGSQSQVNVNGQDRRFRLDDSGQGDLPSSYLVDERSQTAKAVNGIGAMFGQAPNGYPYQQQDQQQSRSTQQQQYGHTPPFDQMSKETLMGIAQSMGLLTPGNSTELNAHLPSELVSPLPQDFLNSLEGSIMTGARNFTPMISPAITSSNGAPSSQASPNFQSSGQQQTYGLQGPSSVLAPTDTQNQLDAIRRQQIEIQRQLDRLSQQQVPESPLAHSPANSLGRRHQLGDSVPSPLMPMGSNHGMPPHGQFQGHRSDSMTPLTSPALNPYPERFHTRSNSTASTTPSPAIRAYDPQYSQHPHSAVPNQRHANDPPQFDQATVEYLASLATLLDATTNNVQNGVPSYNSLDQHGTHGTQGSSGSGGSGTHTPVSEISNPMAHLASSPALLPAVSPQAFRKDVKPTVGPGPHRSNQSGRTRPSPMLRPTGRPPRPSNGQHGNGQHPQHHGYGSVPPSPLISAHTPGQSTSGYSNGVAMRDFVPPALPVEMHAAPSNVSSTSGSLSPVDLTPGVMSSFTPTSPNHQSSKRRASGIAPITPATLMQMGRPVAGPAGMSGSGASADSHRAHPKESRNGQRGTYAVPDAPAGGSSRHSPPDGGIARHPHGASVLNEKTLEGLRSLKVESMAYKAANAKGFAKPARPFKKVEEEPVIPPEIRKTSHKAAEQKRRDSLKASFDELRLLLPPINIEALDPESGEPIPGSSAPRLLPKSSLVPDDNPNKGVSKVALLKFSNDYLARLHTKMDRRENYIDLLKQAIKSLRSQAGGENDGSIDELLEYEFEDEEDEEVPPPSKGKGKEKANEAESGDDELEEDVEDSGADVAAVKRKDSRRGRPSGSAATKPRVVSRKSSTTKVPSARSGTTRRSTGPPGTLSALTDSPRLLAAHGRSSYGQDDVEMD